MGRRDRKKGHFLTCWPPTFIINNDTTTSSSCIIINNDKSFYNSITSNNIKPKLLVSEGLDNMDKPLRKIVRVFIETNNSVNTRRISIVCYILSYLLSTAAIHKTLWASLTFFFCNPKLLTSFCKKINRANRTYSLMSYHSSFRTNTLTCRFISVRGISGRCHTWCCNSENDGWSSSGSFSERTFLSCFKNPVKHSCPTFMSRLCF